MFIFKRCSHCKSYCRQWLQNLSNHPFYNILKESLNLYFFSQLPHIFFINCYYESKRGSFSSFTFLMPSGRVILTIFQVALSTTSHAFVPKLFIHRAYHLFFARVVYFLQHFSSTLVFSAYIILNFSFYY